MPDSLALPHGEATPPRPRRLTFGSLVAFGVVLAVGWYAALGWAAFYLASLAWTAVAG